MYKSLHSAAPRNAAICIDKILVSQPYDTTRFNWRLRAPSRIKNVEKKDEQRPSYKKRLRPVAMGADVGKPFFKAIQQYSEKYVNFLS